MSGTMSEDQNPDPGGSNPNVGTRPQSQQELSDLKDQNEQQLLLINQLKEMLRKEQSTVSQDKVEEYVNTLNKVRAKRSKRRESESSVSSLNTSSASIDANKKERVNLLRQQLEENKAKLAQRGRSQRGIEEMVTQMQAQFKDSQALVPSSVDVDVKSLAYNETTPQKELYNILLTKERKITELLSKSQKLEGTVIDLQENLKEKDSVIDARTKAITLMTDSLSKKGKSTLDALDETKEQMRRMQENFVTLEAEMRARQLTLLNDLKMKNFEITELQEANKLLDEEKIELQRKAAARVSLSTEDVTADLQKEIERLKLEDSNNYSVIEELNGKLQKVTDENNELLSQVSQLQSELNQRQTSRDADSSHSDEVIKQLESRLNILSGDKDIVVEENKKLSIENTEYLEKINNLEKELKERTKDARVATPENEEVAKLKKQLDESNKSMIKMRATQKSKIKELNKKLDQFRKMNDANALVGQLQNEIGKLNEKIAELEDEKGNLQLEMVHSSSSSKDEQSAVKEEVERLKDDLSKAEQELSERDKVIHILEEEVLSLKQDLKLKSEEEVKVSSQVSSEMSSICYEEQIELLEQEKKKLNEQIDLLNSEKEELQRNLEEVKNEKLDLNNKLESYIQENMELIDKLEKMSAEKASSAESIEIVEGLTQQEKLELAAYQKHLNPEDAAVEHRVDDDNIEQAAELNESVLQLSEDTAELLQKIEIFTQERKEVMQKMESLKEENAALNVKIKQIENNRDILEETYEQLQNEKEKLEEEKQNLSEQLERLQNAEHPQQETDEQPGNTSAKELKQLQLKYEALLAENEQLKRTLKDFDSVMQEKYDLESRLSEAVENNSSLDTKLNSDLDEINNYQLTIEENKEELIKSSDIIAKLKSELEERENDIKELQLNISDLNSVISELQNKESGFEDMQSQLSDLKEDLSKQIEQAGDYEAEIAQNDETIRKLNDELVSVNRRMLELENELELKDSELEKLSKEINNKEAIIRGLQGDIEEKDRSFKRVSEDIKEKYLRLQQQLENNDGSLQKQVAELSQKNKDQLEKMKKIAANLKKKSQAYQELEEAFGSEKEKWTVEVKEKDETIEDLQRRLKSLSDDFGRSEAALLGKTEELRTLRDELEMLQQTNADQQKYIQDLRHRQEKQLLETNLQQEMSASLHEDVDSGFGKFVPDDKIRELELLVETAENELGHYKERVDTLQEDLRRLQEANTELELINRDLSEKLSLTSSNIEEKSALQDQLELRLTEISANDEALLKKLDETQAEHAELQKKNKEYEDLIKKLKIKLKKSQDKVNELKTAQEGLHSLEAANEALKNQVASLEEHQRHVQNENEALKKKNASDYEKIEVDYQAQLEELLKARNDLSVDNEKLLEKVKEVEEREQETAAELNEVKRKLEELEESKVEEVRVLVEDLDAANARVQQLNERLREASVQLDQAHHQLDESTGKSDVLEKQLRDLTADNRKLALALEDAYGKLQNSQKDSEEFSAEIQQLKRQIEALEFAKSSLEASCESYQKLEESSANLRLEDPSSSDQKLSLSIPQPAAETACVIEALQAALDSTKEELQATVRQFEDVKGELAELQQKHKPDFIEEVVAEKKIGTQEAVPFFSAFAQPSRSEDWSSNSTVQQLNEQLLEASVQVDRVTRRLHDSTARSDVLERQLQDLTGDNQKLVSELEEVRRKLQKSQNDLEGSNAEIRQLKRQIEALEFAKTSLEASCESYQKLEQNSANAPLEGPSSSDQKLSLNIPQPAGDMAFVVESLQAALNSTKEELRTVLSQFEDVKSELHRLQQRQPNLVEVTQEAAGEIAHRGTVPLFSAFAQPLQSEDWLQAQHAVQQSGPVEDSQFSPAVVEEGREALLKKVKALEFLLYNMDKEKEIALDQCTEMINELTQLIYNKIERPSTDLESQVLSADAAKALAFDKRSLQSLEYVITNPISGPQSTPVSEDIIEPKQAYVCFGDQQQQSIESQVMSDQAIAEQASNKPALQKLEYQQVSPSLGEQQQPVVEPLAQPKQAYLCYTKDDKPQSLEAFEENDDGWAWGPEEARLEAEHLSTVENGPQVRNLLLEIQQLKENVRVLQVEREHHLEEIKQLQIKSGKLIKKYKELKAKYEGQPSKKSEEGFFDLNEAIQDELKTQVQQLEKRLKELVAEHEKEKSEKNNLLKRVEVLGAANDRLTEMKEIQDSEVFRWQRKYEETARKLQEYDWGSDGFGQPKQQPSSSVTASSADQAARIKELEDTLRDLSLDNEELQALLEEQNAKRLELEKNKSGRNVEEVVELQAVNQSLHRELEEVKSQLTQAVTEKLNFEKSQELAQSSGHHELEDAKLQLAQALSEKNLLMEEKASLEKSLGDARAALVQQQTNDNLLAQLRDEFNCKLQENAELNTQLSEKDALIGTLTKSVEELQAQGGWSEVNLRQLQEALQSKSEELDKAVGERTQREAECERAVQEIAEKVKEIERLTLERDQNTTLAEELAEKIKLLSAENQTLKQSGTHESTQNNELSMECERLRMQVADKQAEVERLSAEIATKESQFKDRISILTNELNENWQAQVDQRGADVAESWKLHLEMVEKDYATVQEKMQFDLQELEEKCNILVNENNELRKSVDQEIRNEVDKMSALHKQISSLQQTVNDLNQAILDKDKQIEEIQNNLSNYRSMEQEFQSLKADCEEKERKLSSVNVIIETTQKQFDEKRAVVEELVSILEKQALTPVSYEKQDILEEFQRQLDNAGKSGQEISKLQQLVQELEDKLTRVSGEKNREINGLNQVIEDLEKELGLVHAKEAEIVRLTTDLNKIQQQRDELQQEIRLLQQQNSLRDAEFNKLQQEHSNCLVTLEDCNRKIQEQESVRPALEQAVREKNDEISGLRSKLQGLQDEARNDSNKEVEALNTALAKAKEECLRLQNSLAECQQQLAEAQENLSLKSQELQTTSDNLVQWQQSQAYYAEESNRLTSLLQQRESEYNNSLELLKNNQLTEVQRHYDELLSNKNVDLGTLQAQIQELMSANQNYAERLNQELSDKQVVVQQLNEHVQIVDEDTKQLEELKLIIEDQVTKIEQLKKELFDKSNQYDSLIAEMDVGRLPVTRQPLSTPQVEPAVAAPQKGSYEDDDLSEPVNRAELDLALYMLHQRDVRCEELTVELTQLLEERDTLQLRLSNAIREKEELRRSAGERSAGSVAEVTTAPSDASSAGTSLELARDKNLATKLSELKNVGYKKDKTFVDEQESRRMQQFAIMQQHINDASKLPAEAAAKLVDATYTLSRDVQSPSKVLLNWLWGNNPPKANES